MIAAFSMAIAATSLLGTAVTVGYTFAVIRTEVNQLKSAAERFQIHIENPNVHHNGEFFKEYEKRIEEQISHVSEQVKEIKAYVEEIDGKLDKLK